ncbi:MAG: DUF2460 domain-containing protein [Terriglobales bacterium]
MSNAIFPIPPGNVSGAARGWPIKKWPIFPPTIEQTPTNQVGETRIATGIYAYWQFEMTFPKLNSTFNDPTGYLAKTVGFFLSMQGKANSWLYDSSVDNDNTIPASAPVQFGVGDGVSTKFQITRPIGDYQDIIQNLNGTPVIYDAGTPLGAGVGYSIDAKGVVSFTVAPTSGHVLSWSGKYYFRCRFLKDGMDALEHVFPNYWTMKQLEWKSIIL